MRNVFKFFIILIIFAFAGCEVVSPETENTPVENISVMDSVDIQIYLELVDGLGLVDGLDIGHNVEELEILHNGIIIHTIIAEPATYPTSYSTVRVPLDSLEFRWEGYWQRKFAAFPMLENRDTVWIRSVYPWLNKYSVDRQGVLHSNRT